MSVRRTVFAVGFTVVALFGLGRGAPASAEDLPKEAAAMIQHLGDDGIRLIADKSITEDDRRKNLATLFASNFDVPTIAKFVLGPYWRGATGDQQTQFIDLFRDYIARIYSQRFTQYTGQTFNVSNARSEGDKLVVVTSQITQPGGEPPVAVDWRVGRNDHGLQILDVVVEGISMAQTQRDEFGSMISRDGGKLDSLIASLRQQATAGGQG